MQDEFARLTSSFLRTHLRGDATAKTELAEFDACFFCIGVTSSGRASSLAARLAISSVVPSWSMHLFS